MLRANRISQGLDVAVSDGDAVVHHNELDDELEDVWRVKDSQHKLLTALCRSNETDEPMVGML